MSRFRPNRQSGYKRLIKAHDHRDQSFFLKRFLLEFSAAAPFREEAAGGEKAHKAPVWLISFTDLMALLLAFFVLTFSMSEPDIEKWPQMEGSLKQEFNKFEGPEKFEGGPEVITISRATYRRALNLDYLEALLKTKLAASPPLQSVEVLKQDDRLLLSFPSDLLFEAGKTQISNEGIQAIKALAPALSKIRNAIEISGHADPRPVGAQSSYLSNWHLSLVRAQSVAKELQEHGYERELPITGYSSARYEELGEDVPQDRKLALARRVDIVVLGDDGRMKKDLELKLNE